MSSWKRDCALACLCLLPLCAHAATPMVVAGPRSAVALKSDGTVLTWGRDDSGILGSGRPLNQTTFAQVPGLNLGSGITQTMISASKHVLLVDSQGRVWAWGDNSSGQLGDATSTSRTNPALIKGMSGVRAVSAALLFSVFLKSDGTVWSTVDPTGQLQRVQGLAGIVSVSTGISHAVALKSDGTVWTWGANYNGALGNGLTSTSGDPLQASQVPGVTGVVAVAAGYYNTVVVVSDGTVWGWGENEQGQLLDGTTTTRYVPIRISGLANVADISVAGKIYALKRDGTIWSWGAGLSPIPVQELGLANVVRIAVWEYSFGYLALTSDGTLWGQGENSHGQFGDGTTAYRFSPAPIQGMSNPAAFAGGWDNTVVVKSDGTVWVTGSNTVGQLGLSTNSYRSTPGSVPGLAGVTTLATGGSSDYPCTVALKADGNAWGWGAGACLGTSKDHPFPVELPAMIGAVAVSMGMNSAMVLKPDGTVWMQGSNNFGQRGNGTTAYGPPGFVPGLANVATIVAGSNYNFAITRDGTLWAWGLNDRGQLGDGSNTDRYSPMQIGSGYQSVAAGAYHTVAVKTDGTLWAWGWNNWGQLGEGTTTSRLSPAQIGTGFRVAAAGTYYSAALKTDGSLWAWGTNGTVQPGDGTGTNNRTPAQIGTGFSGLAVGLGSAQSDYALALKPDGTVWTWGANPYGQLGDGTFVGHAAPAPAVNEFVTGILDLVPDSPNSIPASAAPRIVLESRRLGGVASFTLGSNVYFGAIDLGALAAGTFSASGPYKVYVAAIVPAGITGVPAGTYLLDTSRNWSFYGGGPLLEYVSNATLDQTQHYFVSILENMDLSGLIGTRFFVGYGTDDQEMLAAQRYREIFVVQP